MIFEALQGTVNQLIEQYECPECQCRVDSKDINIIGAAGTSINMEVICPECERSEFIEAQVFTLDLSQLLQNKEKIAGLQEKLKNIDEYKNEISDVKSLLMEKKEIGKKINDKEIVSINKVLRSRNLNISDLFGEEKNSV